MKKRESFGDRAHALWDRLLHPQRAHGSNVVVHQHAGETTPMRQRARSTPPVDIHENDKELLIVADVPGTPSDAIDLAWDGHQRLTLQTRCDEERRLPGCDWYRVFDLPSDFDGAQTTAKLEQGVLTLHIPRDKGRRSHRIVVEG